MYHITRLKQIRRRDNLINTLIIDYNIHCREAITKIQFLINIPLVKRKKLSLLKIIIKLFFLKNELYTEFFLISVTWSLLLRARSFLEVIFRMPLLTPNTLKVDEFFMYKFSPSTYLKVETSSSHHTQMSSCININPSLFRIADFRKISW